MSTAQARNPAALVQHKDAYADVAIRSSGLNVPCFSTDRPIVRWSMREA